MKRENVLVSEDALARQREFEAKIKEMFTSREAHPVACVDTFGCQQNVADGQKLMGMLADSGFTFTEDPKEADLVILNTCAVREHAEQRVFGNLGILTHTKKENPEQVICLCGCMAQEERNPTVMWIWCSAPMPCGNFQSFCGRSTRPGSGSLPWTMRTAPLPRASLWCGKRA